MPKVSIIIPVYNVENYLSECLDSVLAQDYDNYEVILINDGSTDKSLNIANNYISKFNDKLKIISQSNFGQSSARNCGLKIAVGDYIYFLDSDDYINDNTLSRCVKVFLLHDVDVVFFDVLAFNDGLDSKKCESINYNRNVQEGLYSCGELFDIFLNGNYMVSACGYMSKKDSYRENIFPVGILHEDNYYTTKLFSKQGAEFYVLSTPFYNRRFRPDSIMTVSKTIDNVDGYCMAAKLLNDECSTNNAIVRYSLILYNRAVDLIVSERIKVSNKYKIRLSFELIRNGVEIKVIFKLLFPSLTRFIKSR